MLAPPRRAADAINFGVLADGRTALIEVNDGYALGAYRIAAAPYTDVLLARWAELLARRRTPARETALPAG